MRRVPRAQTHGPGAYSRTDSLSDMLDPNSEAPEANADRRRLARSLTAIGLLSAMFVSCALEAERDSHLSNGEAVVRRADFGQEWPLTVEGGWLSCEAGGAVIFSGGFGSYAVNPLARGLPWVYKDISEILADDPENPGQKKNVNPLLKRGLELCE
jgi:hypothetical protein